MGFSRQCHNMAEINPENPSRDWMIIWSEPYIPPTVWLDSLRLSQANEDLRYGYRNWLPKLQTVKPSLLITKNARLHDLVFTRIEKKKERKKESVKQPLAAKGRAASFEDCRVEPGIHICWHLSFVCWHCNVSSRVFKTGHSPSIPRWHSCIFYLITDIIVIILWYFFIIFVLHVYGTCAARNVFCSFSIFRVLSSHT